MGIVAEAEFMEQFEPELFKEQIGSMKSETWHSKQRNGIGKKSSNRMLQPGSLVDGLYVYIFNLICSCNVDLLSGYTILLSLWHILYLIL